MSAGTNGYIWVGSPLSEERMSADGSAAAVEAAAATEAAGPPPVSPALRESIARVRNAIVALAQANVAIFDVTILATYDDSLEFHTRDMLKSDVAEKITLRASSLAGGSA
jgi:hypothetical protein